MNDRFSFTFEERLNLLPPFLFYLPSKKLRKHCVAEVVHELADPLVACVLCAREASAALAVDEAHDDALRQGERVVIRAEIQLVLRGGFSNWADQVQETRLSVNRSYNL